MIRDTRAFLIIVIAIIAVIAVSFLFSPRRSDIASSDKPKVSASFFPVYDIARRIGGDRVNVVRILPAGASPHTFEITPNKAKEMRGSKVVFKIGGVDDWTDGVAESIGAERMVLDDGIDIKNFSVPAIGEEEDEGDDDPHYWMTMDNAKIIARNIAAELSEISPDDAEYFNVNLSDFNDRADAADAEIRGILAPHIGGSLIVFHNAWSYFAEEYGLDIAASFEPAPGKEPSPAYLRSLADIVGKKGIKVIFSEPAFSDDSIRSFVSDIGLTLHVLYPEDGSSPNASYVDTMIENARIIARALSE